MPYMSIIYPDEISEKLREGQVLSIKDRAFAIYIKVMLHGLFTNGEKSVHMIVHMRRYHLHIEYANIPGILRSDNKIIFP